MLYNRFLFEAYYLLFFTFTVRTACEKSSGKFSSVKTTEVRLMKGSMKFCYFLKKIYFIEIQIIICFAYVMELYIVYIVCSFSNLYILNI